METHDHIVRRIPVAPDRSSGQAGKEVAEILGAWLWPSTEHAEHPVSEQAGTAGIEVSLLPGSRRLLRDFPVPGMERSYLRHLEQRILRDPRDLLSHVRRLYLASAITTDTDLVAGALADLFLVLGKQGRRLRARLLKLVAHQLTAAQRRFFEAHIESGLDANEAMPDLPQSRLSKRVAGTTRIVVRSNDDDPGSDGPVSLARESMHHGRYDVAQSLLEGALESDPGDREVCDELLELYRHRNLRGSFFKTYTAMLGRRLALPERWAQLAADFQIGAIRREHG